MNRLDKAFELFDNYNRQDPNRITWNGVEYPLEYFYALQLYNWVMQLDPAAPEAVLLASRSQHIGRWESARSSYPDTKAGYLQWRSDLAKFHASTAGRLLEEAGYDAETIEKVQQINLKRELRSDPEVQTIENALCLVFLQYQFESFIDKHDEKKVIRILQKSWGKMTEPGRTAALGLNYSQRAKELLNKALA